MIVIIVHVIGYSANNILCIYSSAFGCYDVGRGMVVHTYAAFFGLGAIIMLPSSDEYSTRNMPSYLGNVLSALGTVFLWIYWPTFNSFYIA